MSWNSAALESGSAELVGDAVEDEANLAGFDSDPAECDSDLAASIRQRARGPGESGTEQKRHSRAKVVFLRACKRAAAATLLVPDCRGENSFLPPIIRIAG